MLDFDPAKANLAIEIDGVSHDMADRPNAMNTAMRGLRNMV